MLTSICMHGLCAVTSYETSNLLLVKAPSHGKTSACMVCYLNFKFQIHLFVVHNYNSEM